MFCFDLSGENSRSGSVDDINLMRAFKILRNREFNRFSVRCCAGNTYELYFRDHDDIIHFLMAQKFSENVKDGDWAITTSIQNVKYVPYIVFLLNHLGNELDFSKTYDKIKSNSALESLKRMKCDIKGE